MKGFLAALGVLILFVASSSPLIAYAATTPPSDGTLQSQIDAQNQLVAQLNQQIAQYQAEIKAADADKKTLQSAITALNLQLSTVKAQVSVTQHQIGITQLQIQQLGTSIATTQQTIEENQGALAEDMRNLQRADDDPLVLQILSAQTLGAAWDDAEQTVEVQRGIQSEVQVLQTQKSNLTVSQTASKQKQNTLTAQKEALATQQKSLTATQNSKTQLLVQTNNSETAYQNLLAQAQAELASFSTFAQNAGGSGILTNQTVCDDWGCYYNQRDSEWGNMDLSGTTDRLAADGCLVTSMAMVMTHYGYADVNPISINSNPSNFSAVGGLLRNLINVDGVSATRITIDVDGMSLARKIAYIDATLNTGNPVVIGLYAYGGTHFVVFTSGRGGNYLMRDPYIPNGKDISFSAHYSLKNIFGVSKVVISS